MKRYIITDFLLEISVGKEGEEFGVDRCVESHYVALVALLGVCCAAHTILLLCDFDLDWKFLIVLSLMLTLLS